MKATLYFLVILGLLFSCHNNEQQDSKKDINSISKQDYKQYCNQRYQFCIEYPSNFIPQGVASNGDGQIFSSKDGKTEIRSYGNLIVEDISSLEESYLTELKDVNITYKKKGDDFFVVSGFEGDNIFYRKSIQRKIDYLLTGKKDTDILTTFTITYPKNQKDQYDFYCKKINKDLK